jgi:hypothetical protein
MDGTDNEACFSKTVLQNTDGVTWMNVDQAKPVGFVYTDKIQLPQNVSCGTRCTLGWRWDAMLENSIFTNCADIQITSTTPTGLYECYAGKCVPSTSNSTGASKAVCEEVCNPPLPTPVVPAPTPDPAPPAPRTCALQQNTDIAGNDIKSVHDVSLDGCCTLCQQTATCGAFTFSPYNEQGQQENTCYLKTSAAAGTSSAGGKTSGTLPAPTTPTPPPAPTPAHPPRRPPRRRPTPSGAQDKRSGVGSAAAPCGPGTGGR